MLRSLVGNAVIVDDKASEVEVLKGFLEDDNVFIKYFDGTAKGLPRGPLARVDTLFLDLHLEGMDGKEPKEIGGRLNSVIERLISPNNGPYTLVLWTSHETEVDAVIEHIQKLDVKIRPALFVKGVSKTTVLKEGKDRLTALLSERYINAPFVRILNFLSRLNHRTLNEAVGTLRNLPGLDDSTIQRFVKEIGIAYHGHEKLDEMLRAGEPGYVTALFHVMDQGRRGHIASVLSDVEFCREVEGYLEGEAQKAGVGDEEARARINSWLLFLRTEPTKIVSSGNIYAFDAVQEIPELRSVLKAQVRETFSLIWGSETFPHCWIPEKIPDFKKKLKEALCLTSEVPQPNIEAVGPDQFVIDLFRERKGEFVYLEISPVCDDSQRKWKQNRLLPGVLIPYKMISKSALERLRKNISMDLLMGKFFVRGQTYFIVFDLRFLHTIPAASLQDKVSFAAIGTEPLTMIQSHCLTHQSRPGVVLVRDP